MKFLMLLALVLCTAPALAQTQPAAPTTAPASVTWLATLDEGYKDAAKRQRPMLVIYGADWCVPCRELQKELDRAQVREKLSAWTLVHLDVDNPEPGAQPFTGPIPTLRSLTANGKSVSSHEGYFSADEFLRWLAQSAPQAGIIDPDLAATDAPDAAAVARLIAKLSGADAASGEVAAKRLAPWPDLAAAAVADAFANGNLRTRLATIDLLSQWGAPVNQIDPWDPASVTASRLDAIRKWAASAKRPTTQTSAPSQSELSAAQEDLASLLRATSPAEANVIRDRLARLGPALLPEIYQRLKQTSSDRDRQRLTALRYRLVCSDALALQWSGGLERLASVDAQIRRDAAEELAHRATAGDGRLLLEMFSDSDPLIREISLRGLQAVGGVDGTGALVGLLSDPVANVRAAVLKQLAESPAPPTTDAVIKYVATEKDPDLVVHAVRVFRAAKGDKAVTTLLGLLSHESWRVRAEAIDALATIYEDREGKKSKVSPEEVGAAIAKLLDDSDGFVAGRAMAAMKSLGGAESAQLLADAAKRHPELALQVVKQLTDPRHSDPASAEVLRAFCTHADPAVRATAVRGVANMAPKNCDKEIVAALNDKVAEVRVAGAEGIFHAIEQLRPEDGYIEKPSFFGFGGGRVKVDPNEWLEKFRSGTQRPSWLAQTIPNLQAMLKSDDPAQRLAAAMPLAALGSEDDALPIVTEAAKSVLASRQSATRLLPWLPWEKRLALFKTIASLANDDRTLDELAEGMSALSDPRAAEPLWDLLAQHNSKSLAGSIYSALNQIYFGQRYVTRNSLAPDDAKKVIEATKAKIASGSGQQRVVALALLLGVSAPDAAEQAKGIYEDQQANADFRAVAFQVILAAGPKADAQRAAIAALSAANPHARLLALRYLAEGPRATQELQEGIYLFNAVVDQESFVQSNQPVKFEPPPGLVAEPLMPLLGSTDREEAALAGYLLCLLGKHEGLAPLVEFHQASHDRNWDGPTRLLTRGISALDDDNQTPLLEQIYSSFNKEDFYMREFYWTIRGMHGTQILKLRKKIRDEVGMERLQ
jgi:thioredoxin-like negative regulator of GroEL/HEAT repeat protein